MKSTFLTVSLCSLATCAFCADSGTEQPKDLFGNADKAFAYTGEDLTRLPTRLGVSYDSNVNHNQGSNYDSYLVTGSLSLLGLQVLADVPVYTSYNPGVGETKSGFGDTFISGAFSLPFNPKLRVAIGMDALLDTSSRNDLGSDETIYGPFLGLGFEMDEKSMAIGKFSYTDSTHDGIERLELLIRGLHRFNEQLFSSVELTPGWDLQGDEVLLNARALAGARIDRNNVASIEFELPIDSDSRDLRGSSLRLNYHFLF